MRQPLKRYGLLASIGMLAALIIIAVPLLEIVHAQAPMPGAPYIFHGDVTLNSSPAPQNTTITAQIGSLSWYTVVDANHQYGESPAFIILANSAATGEPKNGWAPGDLIQFTVGGINAQTYSCTDGGRKYLALSAGGGGTPPAVPVLSSPLNTATGVSIMPTLQWGASSGAITYSVLLATNQQFTGPIVNQAGISGIQYALPSALGYSTQYFWKVKASNSAGDSDWSTPWSFTTVALSPPAAPVLALPLDTATGVSTTPTLQWNTSAGAISYTVQVSTNNQFSSPVVNQATTSTQYAVTSALSNNTVYWWRVNASNPGGTSSWSTWSFTTINPSTLPTPVMYAPGNTATGVPVMPLLQWNVSTGATSYGIQVSTDVNFSTTIFNVTGLSAPQYYISTALNNSTQYFWRVNAANGTGGLSGWSSPWYFVTVAGSGGGSSPGAPALYRGTAYINSNLAVGAAITAYINNTLAGTATADPQGRFGYDQPFPVTGTPGNTITFKVSGVTASETKILAAGLNTVTLYSTGPVGPTIVCSQASFSFTAAQCGSNPSSQILTITNGGSGTLSWTATSSNPAWLTLSPGSGTAGDSTTLSVNVAGMTANTYSATITIAATGATPVTVPVSLVISAAVPVIVPSSPSFTFNTPAGVNPANQSLTITNGCSTGTLSWTATDNASWLTLTPDHGTAGGSTTLSVNVASLGNGTYAGLITISATGATDKPVPVTLNVGAPTIVLSSTSFTFSTTAGTNPANQTLAITNGGTGTLNWTATDNATWLTLSPTSGTNAGSVTLSVNVSGLVNGTYAGLITVSATGATNTPQTVPVTLNIGPSPCGTDPIGCTTGTPYGQASGNTLWLCKYTAYRSATINNINVIAIEPSTIKVAIYSDNSGAVGTLIGYNNTAQSIIAGLNTIPITATPIYANTAYWLAIWSTTAIVPGAGDETGTTLYQSNPGMTTFPTSLTGTAYNMNVRLLISGVQ